MPDDTLHAPPASNAADAAALEAVKAAVGPKGWSQDPERIAPKVEDWRGRVKGGTPLLVAPASADEVAAVVRACAAHGLAITPQGGNTGLVGGGTPMGEILMTLERMRAIRAVDAANMSLTVEAGAPLQAVQEAAADVDRLFPLMLGSQGTATIGGLLSTNAGGVHVLRYGMMRDLTLGLEAVLPDGRIWSGLRGLRKDNTGYDLKQLFIGAEGTLGVITAAVLRLFPRPAARAVAMAGVAGPDRAPELLARLQDASGGAVTGFELIPAFGLELCLRHLPGARAPMETVHPWTLLIEFSVGRGADPNAMMEAALADAFERELIKDAAIAANEAQAQAFWKLREELPEAEKRHGKAIKHDVSAPLSAVPTFLDRATAAVLRIAPTAGVLAFGHAGDGNIHFNISAPEGTAFDAFLAEHGDAITHAVHEAAAGLDGSISAEHGVGTLKRDELARRRPLEVELMRGVKAALDPQGIMNPRVLLAPGRD